VRRDSLVEHSIGRGVDDAETIAQDTDGTSTRFERGAVSHCVEAPGHAAHHHEPGLRGYGRDPPGHFHAVAGGAAAPHDGNRLAGSQGQLA
jgi:hypothetical protein